MTGICHMRHDEEAEDAPAPRHEQHPHQAEFQHQGCAGGKGMEPVRQMLHVPADPGRQRPVLVVLVHGGEVAPLRDRRWPASPRRTRSRCGTTPIAAGTGWRGRRMIAAEAWTKSRRREEQRDESRLQQHAVRLVAGEILRSGNEGEKADEADEQHAARPDIGDQQQRGDHAHPAQRHQHVRAAGEPEQVGAYQKRTAPSLVSDPRYSFAGRMPFGPISPRI